MDTERYRMIDIYTKIVNTMDRLRKKDVSLVDNITNDEDIDDIVLTRKVKCNNNITFDVEAYYDKDSFALFEFQIYYKIKGKYEDCCTLPSYFGESQEKDLREFVNMYV